jgi:hypothetical protein
VTAATVQADPPEPTDSKQGLIERPARTKAPYTDERTTVFSLSLASEPTVEIAHGMVSTDWTGDSIVVTVDHSSGAGAVNIRRD